MKILFSTDQIYLHGGIEKVIATKANYFADVLGYEVVILTTEQMANLPCYRLSDKIRLIDIGINYDRTKSYFSKINLTKIPKHFSRWNKVMREQKPDVLISCNYAFDFYWIPFFNRKIKKLKEYHSSGYAGFLARKHGIGSRIKYAINDFINSGFDRIVLLNPSETSYYRTNNAVIIPNSTDISNQFASLDNNRAIAAGRIAPVKRFDILISMWKDVVRVNPAMELDIFGEGQPEYVESLRKQIADFGIGKNVRIHPATSDLKTEMLHSSMYVMTSESECYPMVLLEALSCGLPVVSFDCPTGPRHIVTDGSDGWLVPHHDEKDFCEKVLSLASNRDKLKALGANASENSARFSHDAVMPLWVTLFGKLSKDT